MSGGEMAFDLPNDKAAEQGWRDTPGSLKASYGNCEGWTGMLCAMKVWIEHGINLRQDFYK